jgi:hypothetical protein
MSPVIPGLARLMTACDTLGMTTVDTGRGQPNINALGGGVDGLHTYGHATYVTQLHC